MNLHLYGIPHCDTVKKARQWLAQAQAEVCFHDFKKEGLSAPLLTDWVAQLGWEALLNRKGTSWRKLDESTRAAVVDAASAQALMLQQPSLIKRPVVRWPHGALTVGFDAERFAALWAQCRSAA